MPKFNNTEEFVTAAKLVHQNADYDYSLVNYVSDYEKVTLICSKHGIMQQRPKNILEGDKCKGCSMKNSNTAEFIAKCQLKHNFKYDYSETVYVNNKTSVKIKCLIHNHIFIQNAGSHLSGKGCSLCKNEAIRLSKLGSNETFIEKAKKKAPEYDYSKVEYIDCNTKVTIGCKKHNNYFERTPANFFTSWNCCDVCTNENMREKYFQEFLINAENKFGNKYDYSLVKYINSVTEIEILCPDHKSFFQTPVIHLMSKYGCQSCAVIEHSNNSRHTQEYFIQKAKEAHGEKYNYDESVYTGMSDKILIKCNDHGLYWQLVSDHISGRGCSDCGKIKCSLANRSTTDEFIEKARKVHGETYSYNDTVYIRKHEPLIITCKIHGKFIQRADIHLRGFKCKKCNKCPSCLMWFTHGELCDYCQPKENNKLYTKTKEYYVVTILKERFPDHEFIHNRSVGSECTGTHLFPDIRFDFGHYNLIIEVDEHKHRGANYKCDKQRMYDIIAKLGQPCIFIRYNPDSKATNIEKLVEKIHDYIDMEPEDDHLWNIFGFRAIYLFYD